MDIVFMFGGQGSQTYGMAKQLFDNNEVFHSWMEQLDRMFLQRLGCSFIQQMYQASHGNFHNLEATHPAVFSVEYALYQMLKSFNIHPDYVWGMSLGEYVSAVVTGIMALDQACDLISKQVILFKEKCELGFMAAVLHDVKVYESLGLSELTEFVSYNFQKNFIIGGEMKRWNTVKEIFDRNKITYTKMPVDYAFHTKYIDVIKEDYLEELYKLDLCMPKIKYISSIYDKRKDYYSNLHYWKVIREPMNFIHAMCTINDSECIFVDCTPSGTMENLLKYNQCRGEKISLLPFWGNDSLQNLNNLRIFLGV